MIRDELPPRRAQEARSPVQVTVGAAPRRSAGIRISGGTLRTVRDTAGGVLLRFPHATALLLLFVFAAATAAIVRFIPDAVPRVLFGGMFGLVTLVIGVIAFWREELELSFGSGMWRMRRGFVWSGVAETRGSLAEIPEVELVLDRRASGDDGSPSWMVRIQAPSWPTPVTVASAHREEAGYAELERWAKRLRKDAVDRTGDVETRTPWDALDRPVALRTDALAAAAAAPPSEHPPAGSRIVVTSELGRRRIVLPPVGFNLGVAFMALFGLVFGGIGLVFALVAATVIPDVRVNGVVPTSPVWPMVIMGGGFAVIGLLIALAPAVGARAREWIEDGADALVVGYRGMGLTWGVKRLPKGTIEGVDLSASPRTSSRRTLGRLSDPGRAADADPRDLRIRTDAKVLRVGRHLSVEELRWLRDRVEAMARR